MCYVDRTLIVGLKKFRSMIGGAVHFVIYLMRVELLTVQKSTLELLVIGERSLHRNT